MCIEFKTGVLKIALVNFRRGCYFRGMAEKTLTARQVAERYNVAGSTVRGWLLRKLIPGAYLKESGLGDSYWLVPESSLKNFTPPKPGPAPKAKSNGAAKKKGGKK
jgi:hypothetical protein